MSIANQPQPSLAFTSVPCCVCGEDAGHELGRGEDFEYRTSPDVFRAVRCPNCGLVYLNPRPAESEFGRIYPSNYHAFEFSKAEFGIVYKVRQRLEARRLLGWCRGLRDDARILDVGCGDGFHLKLLRDFGNPSWRLEGVDADTRAALVGEKKGLTIHGGLLEDLDLPVAEYDLAFVIQTIEHVADPPQLLRSINKLLRPDGRVVIVTDNTATLDFRLSRHRYWGGYHFPRHWNLFNQQNLRRLAENSGYEILRLTTAVSPVNWVYSIRNYLTDKNAPGWLNERFSLRSTVSLSFFTAFDLLNRLAGHGALLNAVLKKCN